MSQSLHIKYNKALIKIMNIHRVQNTKTFIKFIH